MEEGTTFVAFDDSKRRIVAGILRSGESVAELRELPNTAEQVGRFLRRLRGEGAPVRVCYEAGVSGYELYRQVRAQGAECVVVAPSLTPRRPGQRVKTDRRDARKLVGLFRAGELTAVHVPDEDQEGARDLVRLREAVRQDVMRWRHRLLKLLLRHGRVYTLGRHWSAQHWRWIDSQRFADPHLQQAVEGTREILEQAAARLKALDQALTALADLPAYREAVGWLRCFRGVNTLSAVILLTEVVDFRRFHRARELMAYLGLVPSEYASGERHARGGLTKAGNAHARRILIEAAWHYRHRPALLGRLARCTQGQPRTVVDHAWRAQQRLHRRYRHLLGRGKRGPVVAAAIARELVGFLWAVMQGPAPQAA
jgi:transposase